MSSWFHLCFFWIQNSWVQTRAPPLSSYVTVDGLFNQFPYPENKDGYACLLWFSRVNCVEQCTGRSECSVDVSCDFHGSHTLTISFFQCKFFIPNFLRRILRTFDGQSQMATDSATGEHKGKTTINRSKDETTSCFHSTRMTAASCWCAIPRLSFLFWRFVLKPTNLNEKRVMKHLIHKFQSKTSSQEQIFEKTPSGYFSDSL